MQLIEFRDTCKISRDTKAKDSFGNPLKTVVYEGPCCYQEGGQTYSYNIITRSPALYLPSNDALVEINDSVEVTTETGRKIKSLVEIARDVRLQSAKRFKITKIELKQATGK